MTTKSRNTDPPGRFGMGLRSATYLFLTLPLAFALTLAPVRAHDAERSGKQVVETVCAACHETGAEGAPMIGDVRAWSVRASQGLSSLTLHALEGIRKMPAHGGRPDLSDLEIARAVTYMVNRSGGNWIEPTSAEELNRERSGEWVVMAQCINCHGQGVGGAPKVGDRDAWVKRINKGLGTLVHSAIRGHGGMPPRGGQANLTDVELRSAILYMYNPAGPPAKPSSSAATVDSDADKDSLHKIVGGIDIYLGFIPAEMLRRLPRGSPERSMHGGIPKGSGYYHVNVSLFDELTRSPVNDAVVLMEFAQPGFNVEKSELERMAVGAGSYGNYTKPEPGTRYLITLRIQRPGATHPVEAKFRHRFE